MTTGISSMIIQLDFTASFSDAKGDERTIYKAIRESAAAMRNHADSGGVHETDFMELLTSTGTGMNTALGA
jgi:hypothetical protein